MRKEIPMLFQTPMVQAIQRINDPKTMTRRTKGLDELNADKIKWVYSHNSLTGEVPRPAIKYDNAVWYLFHPENSNAQSRVIKCPYKACDLIWVKETHSLYRDFASETKEDAPIIYRAQEDRCGQYPCILKGEEILVNQRNPWTPSILMKKVYARIWMEIVSVRVEKLQDISEEDARAEGIERVHSMGFKSYEIIHKGRHKGEPNPHAAVPNLRAVTSFQELWESIHGLESWKANPWVWVIEFKRVNRPAGHN